MKIETWQHCYDDSWKGLITTDSFAHPAKMARGLVRRIFDELFAMNALRKGDTVLDPFGGVGTTGIEAASRGVQVYLCELEPRFVNFAEDNFVLHEKGWAITNKPRPIMLQGDSRKLREVLSGVLVECMVSSPPFSPTNCQPVKVRGKSMGVRKDYPSGERPEDNYGDTNGQLGNMKQGSVDAVVSSPPYSESIKTSANGSGIDYSKTVKGGTNRTAGREAIATGYGNTTGQLGAMPAGEVDAVVSSPPYEGCPIEQTHMTSNKRGDPSNQNYRPSWTKKLNEGYAVTKRPYGETDGQLGSKDSETFWEAARDIVLECHAVLKPGGIAVWVVKDFVRNKKRVRFSDDWIKLCEACGFKLIRHAHAMLVKETRTTNLFGEETIKRVERKSFFRRLHEQKLDAGDERRIDHEDVVFFRKS